MPDDRWRNGTAAHGSGEPDPDLVLPGDISVSTEPGGFVLARAVREPGRTPRWEFIEKVGSLRFALEDARGLAIASGSRIWFVVGRQRYQPIPLDDDAFRTMAS